MGSVSLELKNARYDVVGGIAFLCFCTLYELNIWVFFAATQTKEARRRCLFGERVGSALLWKFTAILNRTIVLCIERLLTSISYGYFQSLTGNPSRRFHQRSGSVPTEEGPGTQ